MERIYVLENSRINFRPINEHLKQAFDKKIDIYTDGVDLRDEIERKEDIIVIADVLAPGVEAVINLLKKKKHCMLYVLINDEESYSRYFKFEEALRHVQFIKKAPSAGLEIIKSIKNSLVEA